MKKKPYHQHHGSPLVTGTLTRSRTYIVVPRDVPPENFLTVSETRKVRKVGLCRCLLPPLGIILLVAALMAGVGFLIYRYNGTVTEEWPSNTKSLSGAGCPEGRMRREGGSANSDNADCRWNCTDGNCRLQGWEMEAGGHNQENVMERMISGQEEGVERRISNQDEEMEMRMLEKEEEMDEKQMKEQMVAEDYYMEMGEEEDLSDPCPAGEWGVGEAGCEACLCSVLGSVGATCDPASGQCTCRPGYTGHKCNICAKGHAQKFGGCEEEEEREDEGASGSADRPCARSPCQGGATCEEHDGTFTCYCTPVRSGKYCEKVMTPPRADLRVAAFTTGSYVHLRPFARSPTRTSIELTFKSYAKDGLLLYTENPEAGQWISLTLVEGFVEFQYSLGHGPLILTSPAPLNLGQWHTVKARRYHQDGILMLDTLDPVTGQAPGSEKHLNLTGPTYLGSLPPTADWRLPRPLIIADRRRSSLQLEGCLKELELEDQAVSLVSQREPLLQQAANVGECDQHPCTGLPCRNGGECHSGGDRVQCSCSTGYYGERCGGRRSLCRPNPCESGGRCISNNKDQIECECPAGRAGKLCELHNHAPSVMARLKGEGEEMHEGEEDMQSDQGLPNIGRGVIEFDKKTALSIPNRITRSQLIERRSEYELEFSTGDEGGTLLYTAGLLNMLQLAIVAGHLVIKCELGGSDGQPPQRGVAVSRERVADGAWHRASVRRSGRRLYVRLDDREVFTAVVGGKETALTDSLHTDGVLWIGGLSPAPERGQDLFRGKMRHIHINGRRLLESHWSKPEANQLGL